VLDLHGWGDLHTELHRLSKSGDWTTMTALIDDEVLSAFAIIGEPKHAGAEMVRRFGHLVDRFTLYTPYPLGEAARGRRRGGQASRLVLESALSLRCRGFQQELSDVRPGLVGVERLEHRRRGVAVKALKDGAPAERLAAHHAHGLLGHLHHVLGDMGFG
jgi:hypothetical protein